MSASQRQCGGRKCRLIGRILRRCGLARTPLRWTERGIEQIAEKAGDILKGVATKMSVFSSSPWRKPLKGKPPHSKLRRGLKAFKNGHAAAQGVVRDAPAIFIEDGGAMLVDVNVQVFLDGTDDATGIVLSSYAAAVSHAIDIAQIGVVEGDPTARGQMRKPSGDFRNRVFVAVTGIDEEEIDLRFERARSAPFRELFGKWNVVRVDEGPVRIVRDLRTIVDIHANHEGVVRFGAGN